MFSDREQVLLYCASEEPGKYAHAFDPRFHPFPCNCGIVKVPDLSVSFLAHVNFLLHFGILAESPLSSIDSIR